MVERRESDDSTAQPPQGEGDKQHAKESNGRERNETPSSNLKSPTSSDIDGSVVGEGSGTNEDEKADNAPAPPSGIDDEDLTIYNVVINIEEQYSIWPIDRVIPRGWKAVGKEGRKTECLSYIDEVWTDMGPLSLRKKMEAAQEAKNKTL